MKSPIQRVLRWIAKWRSCVASIRDDVFDNWNYVFCSLISRNGIYMSYCWGSISVRLSAPVLFSSFVLTSHSWTALFAPPSVRVFMTWMQGESANRVNKRLCADKHSPRMGNSIRMASCGQQYFLPDSHSTYFHTKPHEVFKIHDL